MGTPQILNQVGVELEGGYPYLTINNITNPLDIKEFSTEEERENYRLVMTTEDGSLSGRLPEGHCWHEIQTKPLPYLDLPRLLDIIKMFAPPHYNHTCGLHIHTSFMSDDLYGLIATKSFVNYMRSQLVQFCYELSQRFDYDTVETAKRLRDRLDGLNSYCLQNVKILPQMGEESSSDRYAFLNYCYTKHGTLECRVFPMMPVPLIQETVTFYLNTMLQWKGWNKIIQPQSKHRYFTFRESAYTQETISNEGGA